MSEDEKGGATPSTSVSTGTLRRLIAAKTVMDSKMAEERGSFGNMVKQAESEEGLDRFAFNTVARLLRMKGGDHCLRNINLYHQDLKGNQADIEDAIKERKATIDRIETAMGGSPGDGAPANGNSHAVEEDFEDPVRSVIGEDPESRELLAKFSVDLEKCSNARAVQRRLTAFVKHHPDLADLAERRASDRSADFDVVDQGGPAGTGEAAGQPEAFH